MIFHSQFQLIERVANLRVSTVQQRRRSTQSASEITDQSSSERSIQPDYQRNIYTCPHHGPHVHPFLHGAHVIEHHMSSNDHHSHSLPNNGFE